MPSILRGFSAPVVLDFDYTDSQLLTLLAHDTDPFNRWEAAQRLTLKRATGFIKGHAHPAEAKVLDAACIDAMRGVLRHPAPGRRLQGTGADPAVGNLHRRAARRGRSAAHSCGARSHARPVGHGSCCTTGNGPGTRTSDNGAYRPDTVSSGRRALAGLALSMLCLASRHTGDVIWPGKT